MKERNDFPDFYNFYHNKYKKEFSPKYVSNSFHTLKKNIHIYICKEGGEKKTLFKNK